ncbi:MAG: hypothetical protein P8K78_02335 [Pirellulales bacterium]|nr:hypothetical protein [Pirellulales bacterium]
METLSMSNYVGRLTEGFGSGWNRFWYLPSDPLPLCLIRIVTGLFALLFVFSYTADLSYFFAQGGLLPFELTEQYQPNNAVYNPANLSYLSHLDSPLHLNVAHWIGIVILGLFTIGCFSRVTAVLGLIVTLSYIQRAPLLTSEFEPLLAALQFYLCLSPCGARLSVDRYLADRKGQSNLDEKKYFSATLAIRLIQVHLCIVAAMMGLAKISGPGEIVGAQEWYDPWGTGEAVWMMISRPQSRLFESLTFLREHPYLVAAWTHLIVLVELLFPILIWNRLARPLVLVLGAVTWFSLMLISGIAPFYALLLVASLSFVSPGRVQRWLGAASRTAPQTQADGA